MAAGNGKVPLEIGTRGTIGSLVKREIEYFTEFEFDRVESCTTYERSSSEEIASKGRRSWPIFSFSLASWRIKKTRNTSVIQPAGICDNKRVNEIPGFTYQNLRGAHSFEEI